MSYSFLDNNMKINCSLFLVIFPQLPEIGYDLGIPWFFSFLCGEWSQWSLGRGNSTFKALQYEVPRVWSSFHLKYIRSYWKRTPTCSRWDVIIMIKQLIFILAFTSFSLRWMENAVEVLSQLWFWTGLYFSL